MDNDDICFEDEEYIGEDTVLDLDEDYYSGGPDEDFVWHPAASDGPLSVDFYQGVVRRKAFRKIFPVYNRTSVLIIVNKGETFE